MANAINTLETWYEETATRGDLLPRSEGAIATEICIIGGGLAGITCAAELARRGKRVVLLEAKRLAWGASGRNGGFTGNGFAAGLDEIATRVGLDQARALYRLSAHGTEYVRREIAGLDATALTGEGVILAQRVDDEAAMQKRRDAMARDFDTPLEYLSTEETRVLLRTDRYFQSLRNSASFHIHPLRYALALAESARASGAVIHENDPALAVERRGASFIVRTGRAANSAEQVIHCVSSLDRCIHPPSGRAVLPVATYVAVTAPLDQDAILTRAAIGRYAQGRRLLPSHRRRPHFVGRAHHHTSAEPQRLAETMKRDMLSVYPQLGDRPSRMPGPGLWPMRSTRCRLLAARVTASGSPLLSAAMGSTRRQWPACCSRVPSPTAMTNTAASSPSRRAGRVGLSAAWACRRPIGGSRRAI